MIPIPLGVIDSTSPPIVTSPPAVSVSPPITRDVRADGVIAAVFVMNVDAAASFTITVFPVGESDITCTPTVTTLPGFKVWLPITRKESEFSVNVAEPATTTGSNVEDDAAFMGPVLAGRGSVMTSCPVVMAEPGKSVWEPITNPEFEFSVILELAPAITTTGVEFAALGGVVDAPLTIIAPLVFTDTVSRLTVVADPGIKVCEPITTAENGPMLTVEEPIRTGAGVELVLTAATGLLDDGGGTKSSLVEDAGSGLLGEDGGAGELLEEGGGVANSLDKGGRAGELLEEGGGVDELLEEGGGVGKSLDKGGRAGELLEESGGVGELLEDAGLLDGGVVGTVGAEGRLLFCVVESTNSAISVATL